MSDRTVSPNTLEIMDEPPEGMREWRRLTAEEVERCTIPPLLLVPYAISTH